MFSITGAVSVTWPVYVCIYAYTINIRITWNVGYRCFNIQNASVWTLFLCDCVLFCTCKLSFESPVAAVCACLRMHAKGVFDSGLMSRAVHPDHGCVLLVPHQPSLTFLERLAVWLLTGKEREWVCVCVYLCMWESKRESQNARLLMIPPERACCVCSAEARTGKHGEISYLSQ